MAPHQNADSRDEPVHAKPQKAVSDGTPHSSAASSPPGTSTASRPLTREPQDFFSEEEDEEDEDPAVMTEGLEGDVVRDGYIFLQVSALREVRSLCSGCGEL